MVKGKPGNTRSKYTINLHTLRAIKPARDYTQYYSFPIMLFLFVMMSYSTCRDHKKIRCGYRLRPIKAERFP